MSAEESRLFPEVCKGDIKRHKVFLIIRNNIVSSIILISIVLIRPYRSYECGLMNLEYN